MYNDWVIYLGQLFPLHQAISAEVCASWRTMSEYSSGASFKNQEERINTWRKLTLIDALERSTLDI